MPDLIKSIELFPLAIPRDEPYLGPLETGTQPNEHGYFVRPGNKTIYSTHDQSVLVKVTSESGVVGWGESFGVTVPDVVAQLQKQLIAPLVIGRDPHDVMVIYEDLYDALRVRGFYGGFWVDAIAGVDMAIWDLRGKLTGLPVYKLLGGLRHPRVPVYVSGLPGKTKEDRAALGKRWIDRGFTALKFAAAVADEGEVAEMRAIRAAVGPDVKILADLHWRYTALEAIQLIEKMDQYDLYLAEAPCESEDIDGQAQVARSVKTQVAIGEELRTVYEYRPRFLARCMNVIQPEMAHTGITAFWRICQMAQAFHCKVMPHATINVGIVQAASLQVSATLANLAMHEYQHSIFDRNLQFVETSMRCANGYFNLPEGPGLGVEPKEEIFEYVVRDA
jgi:L-alanine-DL-glutamate epimerase-like enolase superfamily enzyme